MRTWRPIANIADISHALYPVKQQLLARDTKTVKAAVREKKTDAPGAGSLSYSYSVCAGNLIYSMQ